MVDGQADADPADALAEIERRLEADEWILVSELATLFGVHHTTAHRWVAKKKLVRSRPSGPAGGTTPLLCHPDDGKTLLRKHRGED